MTHDDYLKFIRAYMVAALWSSTLDDDDCTFMDQNYYIEDIADETRKQMRNDCFKFLKTNWKVIFADNAMKANKTGHSMVELAGHDFWLTRNRHGAGFWDRDYYTKEQGQTLTKACNEFGVVDLIVGNDGRIYQI